VATCDCRHRCAATSCGDQLHVLAGPCARDPLPPLRSRDPRALRLAGAVDLPRRGMGRAAGGGGDHRERRTSRLGPAVRTRAARHRAAHRRVHGRGAEGLPERGEATPHPPSPDPGRNLAEGTGSLDRPSTRGPFLERHLTWRTPKGDRVWTARSGAHPGAGRAVAGRLAAYLYATAALVGPASGISSKLANPASPHHSRKSAPV
jgi:hypothetical protein